MSENLVAQLAQQLEQDAVKLEDAAASPTPAETPAPAEVPSPVEPEPVDELREALKRQWPLAFK